MRAALPLFRRLQQKCSSAAVQLEGKLPPATWEIRAIKVKTCETGSCALLVVRPLFSPFAAVSPFSSPTPRPVAGQLSGGHVPHSSRQVLCHPALRTDLPHPPTTPCPPSGWLGSARLTQIRHGRRVFVFIKFQAGWAAQQCVQP